MHKTEYFSRNVSKEDMQCGKWRPPGEFWDSGNDAYDLGWHENAFFHFREKRKLCETFDIFVKISEISHSGKLYIKLKFFREYFKKKTLLRLPKKNKDFVLTN